MAYSRVGVYVKGAFGEFEFGFWACATNSCIFLESLVLTDGGSFVMIRGFFLAGVSN
jgi:hypothetical protein